MVASKLAILFVSLVVLVAPGLADGTVLSGTFVLRNDATLVNASLSGTFYYRYPKSVGWFQPDVTESRVRYEYKFGDVTVSELYDYKNQAKFSMCTSKCVAEVMEQQPDKWWYTRGDTAARDKTAPKGFTWYNRGSSSSNQLKSICLSTKDEPTTRNSFKIAGIEFFDGRKLTIDPSSVKVNDVSYDSDKFSSGDLKCPVPTCKTFADLIFVVDNSGSLNNKEWNQQISFVKTVQKSFTLGSDATYTSLISFRAPYEKCSGSYEDFCEEKRKPDYRKGETIESLFGPIYIKEEFDPAWRPTADCKFEKYCWGPESEKFTLHYDLTGADAPGKKIDRPDDGNTCQYYGLVEAMRVLDNSKRKDMNPPPQPIVIVVTDGFDMCPNRTKDAAKKLIDVYGALVIEVGVGLECRYDEEYLKGIASNLAGKPAYVSVDDYASITKIIDDIVAPVCDGFSSSGCSNDCHGFCGCGQCFCPDCDESQDSCFESTCTAHDGTASGCVLKEDPCSKEEDKCTLWTCDGKKPKDQRCSYTNVTCGAEDLKKCQNVKCHKIGGCSEIVSNDNMCDKGNRCEEWKCTGKGEDGCERVSVKDCSDPRPCIVSSCDPTTGQCISTDTCKQYENECFTAVCGMNGCEFANKTKHDEDACIASMTCVNETGWRVVKKTPEYCKEQAEKNNEDILCKLFSCDAEKGGCVSTVNTECNADVCTAEKEAECQSQLKHTETACMRTHCETVAGLPVCKNEMVECESEGPCTVGYCDMETGTCKSKEVENPYGNTLDDNLCFEVFCNSVTNRYEVRPTQVKENCQSDGCALRSCVNETGCVADPSICKSTNCTRRDCVDKQCVETPVVCNSTLCQVGECVEEEGGCVQHDRDPLTVCKEFPATCYDVKCNPVSNACEYSEKLPPESDICSNYTCNNETGEWTVVPKCEDNIVCTDDRCSYDGKCTNLPTDCPNLDMTAYPCFAPACNERRGCYRKLYANAYVDICGNCIREDVNDEASSSITEDVDDSCLNGMGNDSLQPALTTAAVVGIVLVAIVVGIALTVSGVFGTKELVKRAQGAQNQSAHSNPLYETDEQEMTNPAFLGDQ